MLGLNNSYLEAILAMISASPFIHGPVIEVDDRDEVWFLCADIHFIVKSLLHFRELFVKQGNLIKKTYTYHYQRTDGTTVFPYDNAPHFPKLPTAPHHKHIGENDVIATVSPDFEYMLNEVETLIKP